MQVTEMLLHGHLPVLKVHHCEHVHVIVHTTPSLQLSLHHCNDVISVLARAACVYVCLGGGGGGEGDLCWRKQRGRL